MSYFATKSNKEEIMEYSYDRPVGITLLAIWIAIAAYALPLMAFYYFIYAVNQ